jgi:hypothetical protein
MNRSFFVRIKRLAFFLSALVAVSLAACGENLASGGACPLLCPPEAAPLKDTIIDAVVVDTSAANFPGLGFELTFILSDRGDSGDTRIITRYDSVPLTYKFQGADSTIVRVDSAFIRAARLRADSSVEFGADGKIEAYDVTDATDDTATAALAAQFTPGNKLGEMEYTSGETLDTVFILLDTARVRSRILNGRNLRVGLRMVSTESDQMRILSANNGGGVLLTVVPNRDTAAQRLTLSPITYSPVQPSYLRGPLADFAITVGGFAPPANVLRVGGSPSRRVLLKFDIPSRIVDSTVVVRASLLLTQRPSSAGDAGEAVAVHIAPVVASSQLSDLHAQLEFAGSSTLGFRVDSLTTIPKDSGVVSLEMVRLVRAWANQDTTRTPRLAALFLSTEASRVAGFEFFSMEAAASLRPRLRITYVTRRNSGQP